LHGDIPPNTRLKNFEKFKERKSDILVATDLASRGLDLPFVSHIINFDFPKTTSDYLHRAGRAGRAGR
jgi:superfamily II DNA/RNA helicase